MIFLIMFVVLLIKFEISYSDPSIQPTKPIANLQQKDESQFRKVPKGRYDTTYRREYLNFANVRIFTFFFFKEKKNNFIFFNF